MFNDDSTNTFGSEIIINGENLILISISDDGGRSTNDNSKVLSLSKEVLSMNDFDYNAN
ncbi:hypothetical protein [Winogradskyella costae]|uniref:hypothetical protein n=1 Tax=Winogradskyella costae TaxID=2697008 RepID=UPI0015CDCAAB|nr:hypothetical protein [Winogradskyella costae]